MSDKHTTQIGYFDYIHQLHVKTLKPIEIKKSYSQPVNIRNNTDIVFYFGQTGYSIEKIIPVESCIKLITQQRCMFLKRNEENCMKVIEM